MLKKILTTALLSFSPVLLSSSIPEGAGISSQGQSESCHVPTNTKSGLSPCVCNVSVTLSPSGANNFAVPLCLGGQLTIRFNKDFNKINRSYNTSININTNGRVRFLRLFNTATNAGLFFTSITTNTGAIVQGNAANPFSLPLGGITNTSGGNFNELVIVNSNGGNVGNDPRDRAILRNVCSKFANHLCIACISDGNSLCEFNDDTVAAEVKSR